MKKIVSLLLVAVMLCAMSALAIAADKPVISLLTQRHTAGTNDIEDLWWFEYLERKFDVEFELEQTFDPDQRMSLMWGSADVSDLVWGMINDDANALMTYGQEEELLLDWTPYLNAETMPNAYAAMQDYPAAFTASTTPDGAMYALPYLKGSKYYDNTGAFGRSVRVYINTEWMEKCGITEMPKTLDDVLNVLRTFKEKDPKGNGVNNMPLVTNSTKFQDYVWHCLGFYGAASTQEYGTRWAIKDGKLAFPAYSEEARAFLTYWHTMYEEGLFSPDTFTVDKVARRGWISAGYAGMIGDDTLQYTEADFPNWVGLPLVSSEYCENPIASMNKNYNIGSTAVAATVADDEAKLAKIIAIMDYMYTDEAAALYSGGPMKDTDICYEGWEGWYFNEEGKIIDDPTVRGEVNAHTTYVDKMISPYYYVAGRFDHAGDQQYIMAGKEPITQYIPTVDVITGKEILSYCSEVVIPDNWDGWWRLKQVECMQGKLTGIILPNVYLTSDEVETISDIENVITDHIKSESAKFITGVRDLSEFDAYMDELRALGIEEYVEIYTNAYSGWFANTFGE